MPADEIIKGLDAFTEQPRRREKEPGKPWRTIRSFKGPQHLTEAKEDELLLLNPLKLETEKGIPATITIETEDSGGNAQVGEQIALSEVIWEEDWDRLEKDIRSHGWFNESGISIEFMEQIDAAIKKGTASLTNWNTLAGLMHLNDYRDCRLQGIDSYVMFSPIIRGTLVTRSSYSIRAPAVQIGKIVPWSEVKLPITGALSTPDSAKIDCPKIHYYTFLNIPPWPADVAHDASVSEWMIAPARVKYNPKTHEWAFVFEWYGAEKWTKCLYDGGTGYPPS